MIFLCIELFGETPLHIEVEQAFWTHKKQQGD